MKRNQKVALFNAAPRSGKDTGANFLVDDVGMVHMKFASILKDRTHALYGLDCPSEYYDSVKDRPHKDFLGISPREAYINVAEKLMKPVHGQDVFSQMLADQIRKSAHDLIVVSDLGFDHEVKFFVNEFGVENILLIQVMRQGCTWELDSRVEVETVDKNGMTIYPGLQTARVVNQEIDKYQQQLVDLVADFIAEDKSRSHA